MGGMTREQALELFEYDRETGKLYWKRRPRSDFKNDRAWKTWNGKLPGREVGSVNSGYRSFNLNGKSFKVHRVIYLIETGAWPIADTDHIDGDTENNRFPNLRAVPHAENMRNIPLRSTNKSGVPGVCWEKSKCLWVARIPINGKLVTLGRSKDINVVIAKRQAAERELGYHENHGRAA